MVLEQGVMESTKDRGFERMKKGDFDFVRVCYVMPLREGN